MRQIYLGILVVLFASVSSAASTYMGNPAAPVKMLVFGSIQCPFAKQFMDYIPQFYEEFGDNVAIQYFHFPLERQPQSFPAAVASECAEEQGYYWEFLLSAFERQRELGAETYLEIAESISGLDLGAFSLCLKSDATQARVRQEAFTGAALGVRGTPTVFVNGTLIRGALPYEDFQDLIHSKLAE